MSSGAHLDALHTRRVPALAVHGLHPEGVDGRVPHDLGVLPRPEVVVAVHLHREGVDLRVLRVHDLQHELGPVRAPGTHTPVELGLVLEAHTRAVAQVVELRDVTTALRLHLLHTTAVVLTTVLRLDPERVLRFVAELLLEGEDVGRLLALARHLEVVVLVVVRVVDGQGDLGLAVRGVDDAGPGEQGLVLHAPARAHLEHAHVQDLALVFALLVAPVVVVLRLVVLGRAAAVAVSLAVVPAADL